MSEHPNLAAALVAALADVSVVEKANTANTGSYSYDYADIAAVVKATRPALAAHGLIALTPVEEHGDGLKVTVVLLHSSGDRMDFGPFPFPRGKDAQATGSLVTYYRRYALVSALGIAAGQDDDGANAHAAAPQQKPEPKTVHPKVQGLVDLMNGIEDADVRKTVKGEFVATYGQPADFDLSKLDEAELFIVETVQDLTTAPAAGDQQEPSDVPTSVEADTASPAAAPADPVTKPATNKPSAAARAALAGEKPALGAVKKAGEPKGVEGFTEAFPGTEEVA